MGSSRLVARNLQPIVDIGDVDAVVCCHRVLGMHVDSVPPHVYELLVLGTVAAQLRLRCVLFFAMAGGPLDTVNDLACHVCD